jgi:vacuolar-type H+-ATPase subunit H
VSEPKAGPQSASVDQAINQVLVAERDAREAVERCRGEAAAIHAAAQERAREIGQRTERRVKAARRTADRAVERALKGLLSADPGAAVQKKTGEE